MKKLEPDTAYLLEPPFEDIPDRLSFCSPCTTAMHGTDIESLVKTKHVTAYKTVCTYDNLQVVKRLEFLSTDSVLIETCVISALLSPNAGYRVAGYLLNPIYPLSFLGTDRGRLTGFWAAGFGDLPWPEGSWLDTMQDGPKYEWKGQFAPATDHRLKTSDAMPRAIRARDVLYQKPPLTESEDVAEKYTKDLQTQQFLSQASKLFVLAEYFGYSETLLMCSFFLSPAPSSGHQFMYKGQVRFLKQKAAESAAKVVAKLIGWYEP